MALQDTGALPAAEYRRLLIAVWGHSPLFQGRAPPVTAARW